MVMSGPLNVSLITHLHYLLLTCAFSAPCWAKHELVTLLSSSLTDWLADWLTDWLTVCLPPPSLTAALGIVLTSGCATSRHCQQQELPGVRIHCCDSDLCNSATPRQARSLHYMCALLSLWLLRMWLWGPDLTWRGAQTLVDLRWRMIFIFIYLFFVSSCWRS